MLPFALPFIAADGTFLSALDPRFAAVQGNIDVNTNAACGATPAATTVDMVGCFDPLAQADHRASGIVARIGGVSYAGLAVRCGAAGSGNGYWWLGTTGVALVGTLIAGAFAVLGNTTPLVATNALDFVAQGTSLLCYINGVLDTSFVDATFPTGVPGVAAFRDDNASGMTNFRATNLNLYAGTGRPWL